MNDMPNPAQVPNRKNGTQASLPQLFWHALVFGSADSMLTQITNSRPECITAGCLRLSSWSPYMPAMFSSIVSQVEISSLRSAVESRCLAEVKPSKHAAAEKAISATLWKHICPENRALTCNQTLALTWSS